MDMPKNRFKAGLAEGRQQLGIWHTIPGNTVTELLAAQGFDWILVDTEHSPMNPPDVMGALQAIAAYPGVSALVRPVTNDAALIKRYLDMGAQTIMVPCVQSADEARAAVAAMHYAPRGIRGVAGLTRASRFGTVPGYYAGASDEMCLLVQVETAPGLERLDEIATVPGVDGVFIGPADLSMSLGHDGDVAHPRVVEAVEGAIFRLGELGVPSGVLTGDADLTERYMKAGTTFTAIGIDMLALLSGLGALKARFGLK